MSQALIISTHGSVQTITLLHRDADFESLQTLGGLNTWPSSKPEHNA